MSTSSTWIQGLIDKGLCRCHEPLAPGKKRCASCLEKLAQEARVRNERYLREGRCRYCPAPVLPGTWCCRKHRKKLNAVTPIYIKAFIDRRRAAGLCITCGEPSPRAQKCPDCTKTFSSRSRKRSAARRARGLCSCGATRTGPFKMCARCRERARDQYKKQVAKQSLAEGKHPQQLDDAQKKNRDP